MTTSVHDFSMKRIDGKPASLGDYRGKVLLVVNVASKCGLTPQYEALEKLYESKRAQGLEVLGFPANDFEGQEPGTDTEIASFCSTNYSVKFPLFSKISVVGPSKHALYQHLTAAKNEATGEGPMRKNLAGYGIKTSPPGEVLWNFEKFLVDREGKVINRFAPDVTPDDARLTSAIESALAAK